MVVMAERTLLIAVMTIVSVVQPSLVDSRSETKLSTQFMSFAKPPDPYSNKILSKNPNHVSFLFYSSPNDTNKYEEINYGEAASASKLSKSKPIKFLIPGFNHTATSRFPCLVKDAYLRTYGDAYSIIVVDWSKLATPSKDHAHLFYPLAVENVETVGVRVGEFAVWLEKLGKLNRRTAHIIGFSLGAHVGGWAGATFFNWTGCKFPRLSGLDPAGPLFQNQSEARKICSTDADYVDCYHTNRDEKGIGENVGSADFWINNGGPVQPGCPSDDEGTCSHERSWKHWRQSIFSSTRAGGSTQVACRRRPTNLLPIVPFNNCKIVGFGESATSATRGTYFVNL